jgi:hypothetical protein
MAVVRFHSAEAWLITASICGRLLLLGAVRLRFTLDSLNVLVLMTPGGVIFSLTLVLLGCEFSKGAFWQISRLPFAVSSLCCKHTILCGELNHELNKWFNFESSFLCLCNRAAFGASSLSSLCFISICGGSFWPAFCISPRGDSLDVGTSKTSVAESLCTTWGAFSWT